MAALRAQLARAEAQRDAARREILDLKDQLDEKENRIMTPRSSRERTPPGRLRVPQHQLLDFGGDEDMEVEPVPRRGPTILRIEGGSGGEESKTPPTSTAH